MAVTGGVLAAVLVALVLVLTVFKSSNPPPAHGMIPTGSTPQQDGQQVASAFLTDWEKGDLAEAANLPTTRSPRRPRFAAYAKDLGLGKVALGQGGVADAPGQQRRSLARPTRSRSSRR